MPERGRSRPVSAAQVRAYAAKAEEFAEAAASDLEDGRNIAATSLAIHAGINPADAVCGARLGKRAAGGDHDQVLTLLRQAGADGAKVSASCGASYRSRPRPSTSPTTSPHPSQRRRSSAPSDAPPWPAE